MDIVPLVFFTDVFIQDGELPVSDLGFVKPFELSFFIYLCLQEWWLAEEITLGQDAEFGLEFWNLNSY